MMLSLFRNIFGLIVLIGFLTPALAESDPPARVGRLSLAEGDVTFRADRQDPGNPAVVNWPVSSGAILDTGGRSRAEVWIGSTAYRLAGKSRTEFVAVDDRRVNLQLATGTLAVTIRDRNQADDLDIETPEGRVRFTGAGRYRIEAGSDRTTIAAQSGTAEVIAGGQTFAVRAGEMATLGGSGRVGMESAPYGDDFDTWVSLRDDQEKSTLARRNVSPYMTGYQDLDAYGDWDTADDYGTVWYPRAVSAGWAPYSDGRWAWVEPWGWTWIDAAPWGFAPFHYGRWILIGDRWGWAPGAYTARPVYAPALVGWYGNPGWSASFSYGAAPAVGWFPLAPREVYVPAYRTSPTYLRQLNVTHVTNVREIERAARPDYRPHYRHSGQPQAVTVVPANTLREGKPVAGAAIRQRNMHELGKAPLANRAPGRDWLPPAGSAGRPTPQGEPGAPDRRRAMPPPAVQQRVPDEMPRRAPEFPRGSSPQANQPPDNRTHTVTSRPQPIPDRNGDSRPGQPRSIEERPARIATPVAPSMPPEAPRMERERRQPVAPPSAPREERRYQPPPAHEIRQSAPQPRPDAYREPPRERPAPAVREAPRPMPAPVSQPREMPRSEPPRQAPPGDGQRGGNQGRNERPDGRGPR
jgi:FecR protein